MAIQKDIDYKGITPNYWRVSSVNVSKEISTIYVELYLSLEARTAGRLSFYTNQYSVEGEKNPFTVTALSTANPFVLSYTYLKTLPEFTDAQDC